MTEQEFLALEPVKQRILVGETLFGSKPGYETWPDYTQSWSGMGLVVKKMRKEGGYIGFELFTDGSVECEIQPQEMDDIYWAMADTAPLAVALAALRAKGVVE